jgi:hypothetical protein
MSLHDDFDKEQDLSAAFDNEQDLHDQFEKENHISLPSKILKNIKNTTNDVINSNLANKAVSSAKSLFDADLDTARAVGQGLILNSGDEIGGALGAGMEYLSNKTGINPYSPLDSTDRDLKAKGFKIDNPNLIDLYRKNQQDVQKEFEQSSERSPYLSLAGQLAGGITSGSTIGGVLGLGGEAATGGKKLLDIARNEGKLKALGQLLIRSGKTYKHALPTMALESALSSKEGGLTSIPEAEKLASDTVGGALFGLPAVIGLQGLTEVGAPLAAEQANKLKNKASDMLKDTPLMRQMKVSYNYGLQGINPKSQSLKLDTTLGKTGLSELDTQRSTKLMNEIYDAEKRIGQGVSSSLENATNAGKAVDLSNDTKSSLQQLQILASKYPEISSNTRAADAFEKVIQGGDKVTPIEAKDIIDYMDAYIGKFKSSTNKTPAEEGILSNLLQTRNKFSDTLKIAIPEYGAAAERYYQFRRLVPETIMSKDIPIEVTQANGFKNIQNEDKHLFNSIKKLNQGATREGTSSGDIQESFVNTIKGLKTFEQQEAERLASGKIESPAFNRKATDIENEIKLNSDDAVARNSMDALEPHTGIKTAIPKAITGTGETGRAMALSSANLGGRISRNISASSENNPIAKIARGVFNAPHQANLELSQKLKTVPGLEKYGESLEQALASSNTNRRNQVLFTIMQNPNARMFVKDEHTDEQQPEQ